MKFLRMIRVNLTRKKTRLFLTVGSFLVSLFLFGLLMIIHNAFYQGVEIAGVDRLIVRNRTSFIMLLPYSYKEKLKQIDGVKAVTFNTWFGGVYQDERNFFPQFALDAETYRDVFTEFKIPEDQWADFMQDRQGCVVGRATAERFGWKIGDRIPIRGTIFTGNWEFNIRAIYDSNRSQDDLTQFWFHYKYLEENNQWVDGLVGWYTVKIADPDHAAAVAAAIDKRFANSPYETTTETEQAMAAGFAKQMGNIKMILLSVGAVVFFTLLLVTGSTMSMAVRERTAEIAVLKTVGFSDVLILVLVLGESIGYALIGGGLGIGLARMFAAGGDPTGGLLPFFYLSVPTILTGLGIALLTGFFAGLVPAVNAMRLPVADALRRL